MTNGFAIINGDYRNIIAIKNTITIEGASYFIERAFAKRSSSYLFVGIIGADVVPDYYDTYDTACGVNLGRKYDEVDTQGYRSNVNFLSDSTLSSPNYIRFNIIYNYDDTKTAYGFFICGDAELYTDPGFLIFSARFSTPITLDSNTDVDVYYFPHVTRIPV